MSRGGYYLTSIKTSRIVMQEMKMLSIEATVEDVNESNLIDKIKNISNNKVVLEFKFDVSLILKLKELVFKNNILLAIVVLREWYDEKSMNFLRYICDGIFVIESEVSGEKHVCKFYIPKMIGNINIQEFIKFRVRKRFLEIDTSKDI